MNSIALSYYCQSPKGLGLIFEMGVQGLGVCFRPFNYKHGVACAPRHHENSRSMARTLELLEK
jgi:hypothetical protein